MPKKETETRVRKALYKKYFYFYLQGRVLKREEKQPEHICKNNLWLQCNCQGKGQGHFVSEQIFHVISPGDSIPYIYYSIVYFV